MKSPAFSTSFKATSRYQLALPALYFSASTAVFSANSSLMAKSAVMRYRRRESTMSFATVSSHIS